MLDALLQGRAWIALVGVLLVGIVFFNVDLLELNRDIARTADKAAQMKRENAGLRLEVARLASSERIQRAAAKRGLELPAPGDVRYLTPRPADARRAAGTVTAPGQGARRPQWRARAGACADPGAAVPCLRPPPTGAAAADHPRAAHHDGPHHRRPPACDPPPQAPAPGSPAGGPAPAAPHADPGDWRIGGATGRAPDRAAVRALPSPPRGRRTARHLARHCQGRRASEARLTQQVENLDVPARRGIISDRRGVELAVSEDAVTVFANPFLIKNPVRVAAKLAPILRLDQGELLEKLGDREKGFTYLRRQMDPPWRRRSRSSGSRGRHRGRAAAHLPAGALASQVIGSVGTDGYGLFGLEQSRNDTLQGDNGKRRLVKDALGEPVSIVEVERAEAGDDMRLTLDAALQERTEAVLAEIGSTRRPRGATALVMDPRTGELLALANWPPVDANNLGSAPGYARQNRAVAASYEPGSTFKAFTVSGALAEGLIRPSTALDLPPTIRVADREIGEAHDRGSLRLTVSDILAQSSNVGSVMIGLKLGARRFDRYVRHFGFGRPTGVDLPGEAPGIILRLRDYSGSSMGNMPIGQGLAVTPIQMAQAYTAIAEGGVMRRPYVIQGDQQEGRRVLPVGWRSRCRGCSKA